MLLEVNVSQHWRRWQLLIMHMIICQINLSQKYIFLKGFDIFLLAAFCLCNSAFLSPPDFRQTMAQAAAKRRDHQRKLGTAKKKKKTPMKFWKKQPVPLLRLIESTSCLSKSQPRTTATTSAFQSPPRPVCPHSALSPLCCTALRITSHNYCVTFLLSELISLIPGSCHCRCAASSSSHNLV